MADNTPLSPEEEQRLLRSMLREAPEKLQESSPLEQKRAARRIKYFLDDSLSKDKPWFNVPDQGFQVGTQQEAAEYQAARAKAESEAARERKVADFNRVFEDRQRYAREAFEKALDEYLKKLPGQTGKPPYGTKAPPPWPEGKK